MNNQQEGIFEDWKRGGGSYAPESNVFVDASS